MRLPKWFRLPRPEPTPQKPPGVAMTFLVDENGHLEVYASYPELRDEAHASHTASIFASFLFLLGKGAFLANVQEAVVLAGVEGGVEDTARLTLECLNRIAAAGNDNGEADQGMDPESVFGFPEGGGM